MEMTSSYSSAVQKLPVLPSVFDQFADLVVGVIHLGAVAHPGHRISGLEELLRGPAAVLREVAHHRHPAPAISRCEQHDRKRPIARRPAQPNRRVNAVDQLHVTQLHRNIGVAHRLGDDHAARIDPAGRRRIKVSHRVSRFACRGAPAMLRYIWCKARLTTAISFPAIPIAAVSSSSRAIGMRRVTRARPLPDNATTTSRLLFGERLRVTRPAFTSRVTSRDMVEASIDVTATRSI